MESSTERDLWARSWTYANIKNMQIHLRIKIYDNSTISSTKPSHHVFVFRNCDCGWFLSHQGLGFVLVKSSSSHHIVIMFRSWDHFRKRDFFKIKWYLSKVFFKIAGHPWHMCGCSFGTSFSKSQNESRGFRFEWNCHRIIRKWE